MAKKTTIYAFGIILGLSLAIFNVSLALADNVDLMDQRYHTTIDPNELNQINSMFPEYGGLDQSLLNPTTGLNLNFNQKATLSFTFY